MLSILCGLKRSRSSVLRGVESGVGHWVNPISGVKRFVRRCLRSRKGSCICILTRMKRGVIRIPGCVSSCMGGVLRGMESGVRFRGYVPRMKSSVGSVQNFVCCSMPVFHASVDPTIMHFIQHLMKYRVDDWIFTMKQVVNRIQCRMISPFMQSI